LSRLGSGERNQPEGGGPPGPSERARASQRQGEVRVHGKGRDEGGLINSRIREVLMIPLLHRLLWVAGRQQRSPAAKFCRLNNYYCLDQRLVTT
jgi:hypothetical protein